MRWLPFEFDGVRSASEVVGDLATIAGAQWGRDETHLSVEPDAAEGFGATGPLSIASRDAGSLVLLIGGVEVTDVAFADIRGAWLRTLDDADYYTLRIDLGSAIVELSDAYNGL